jgi:6-phosphogluconate dehydrogenase
MQLGMVGLGRMGANMRARLREAGHEVIGYDREPELSDVESIGVLVEQLSAPRTLWLMVPAAVTGTVIEELAGRLAPGDLIIAGELPLYRG